MDRYSEARGAAQLKTVFVAIVAGAHGERSLRVIHTYLPFFKLISKSSIGSEFFCLHSATETKTVRVLDMINIDHFPIFNTRMMKRSFFS